MAAKQPPDELRRELEEVEQEQAGLRRTAAELRQSIAAEGPGDAADVAGAITAAEEQEALADALEARGEELRRRLGER